MRASPTGMSRTRSGALLTSEPAVQMLARPQQDDADLVGIDVEDQSLEVFRKQDELLGLDVGQAADADDAVADVVNDAHLALLQLRLLVRQDVVHRFEGIVEE